MRVFRFLVGALVVLLAGGIGFASDSGVTLELTVANQTPSGSSSADWGWWNPSKYDDFWSMDESAEFGLADLRILVPGGEYTIVLEGEWYPTLNAAGSYSLPDGGGRVEQTLSLKTGIYDLGFGRWFGKNDRNGVLPWIGATYMDISEEITTLAPPDSGDPDDTDRANSGLWGVVVGADGAVTVWETLDVTGRLLFRWATGTRSAWINPQDPGGGGSQGGEVKVSDSIDHMMWGLDLGVRWHATKRFWLEAGWRIRDRSLDDGPASFGGPQLKLAYEF